MSSWSSRWVPRICHSIVASWVEQVSYLADIANTQPDAAYAGFVFGLRHQWNFVQRTMPIAGDHMQPLKDAIDHKFLPTTVREAYLE